jgi:hypothetical protein
MTGCCRISGLFVGLCPGLDELAARTILIDLAAFNAIGYCRFLVRRGNPLCHLVLIAFATVGWSGAIVYPRL